MAYEGTEVAVSRSQAQIRDLLVKHGATAFSFGEGKVADVVSATIEFESTGYAVRLRVPLKAPTAEEVSKRTARSKKGAAQATADLFEREAMRIWRVLHWIVKARLEAVEEGVETFEQAFLPHLLDRRTGRTMYEELEAAGAVSQMRALPPGD
jgi:hypothetical protein